MNEDRFDYVRKAIQQMAGYAYHESVASKVTAVYEQVFDENICKEDYLAEALAEKAQELDLKNQSDLDAKNFSEAVKAAKEALGLLNESREGYWMLHVAEEKFSSATPYDHQVGMEVFLMPAKRAFENIYGRSCSMWWVDCGEAIGWTDSDRCVVAHAFPNGTAILGLYAPGSTFFRAEIIKGGIPLNDSWAKTQLYGILKKAEKADEKADEKALSFSIDSPSWEDEKAMTEWDSQNEAIRGFINNLLDIPQAQAWEESCSRLYAAENAYSWLAQLLSTTPEATSHISIWLDDLEQTPAVADARNAIAALEAIPLPAEQAERKAKEDLDRAARKARMSGRKAAIVTAEEEA